MEAYRISVSVVLAVVASSTAPPNVHAAHGPGAEIFYDDFSDTDTSDGSPVTWVPDVTLPGTYDASSGDYIFSSPTGPNALISRVPEYILSDSSIRTQARFNGPAGTLSVALRALEGRAYAAGIHGSGNLFLGRSESSGAVFTELAPQVNLPIDITQQDVILQLDVVGDTLSFWAWPASGTMPATPQLTAIDATYATGVPSLAAFGFDSPSAEAVFRYASVTPEPTTLALLALGGVMVRRRRRRPVSCAASMATPQG